MADKSLGPVLRQRVVYYKGSNTDGGWKLIMGDRNGRE